jgi:GH35 family endo-1,4-beta-xylanase
LCGAYVFGTDGVAIRRVQVDFRNGLIECKKPNQETSGLALLWPVRGFGRLLLPTTTLPEKNRPYNLNVEITRAKLMQIVNKREDWSILNDLGEASGGAQELFIQAIQNLSSPSAASILADESLEKAIVLSEKLAVKQAESFFNAKSTSHGFSRGCLGCRIEPLKVFEERYVDRLMEMFGYVSLPIRWADIEPEKDKYDFSLIDSCIQVLNKKKLAICAGPLLCFSQDCLPGWLMDEKPDFEEVRERAYQFVVKMVSRYADRIRSWIVISSLNMLNHFSFNFEQILEMTRSANMAVKSVSNRVLKIVEIGNPWGEYYSTEPNSMPPIVYIDMLMQSGIAFDAFGLQLRFGKNQSGMHIRDMMEISAVLDKFALSGKALYVTGVEVPSAKDNTEDGELAGEWHGPWNESLQGQWLEQLYKIALSKPFVDSVVYSNLVDNAGSAIPNSGLLTSKFEPKKSFIVLKKLREAIFNR